MLSFLRSIALVALVASINPFASAFPNAPFNTDGRWIKDSSGVIFTYAGVNWPGHADVMIPEGLQYQSVSTIVARIKSSGFNSIRLTFAVEMIDQLFGNGGFDIPVKTAFTEALGQEDGERVFAQVLEKNPGWTDNVTRLEVFDEVAAECERNGIYVHLDNHMSKGQWCCSWTDGNGWFGDQYFDVGNWIRALTYMAVHAKSWPNFVSIGLRNELRAGLNNIPILLTYNWKTWYNYMTQAANAVNQANPDILIFYGGLNSDITVDPLPTAADLRDGVRFQKSDFAYANKMVLEIHNYDNDAFSCTVMEAYLYAMGFNALDENNPSIVNVMPIVLGEFGYNQDVDGVNSVYATCLRDYIPSQRAGWMVWVLAGSYYIREGTQDYDEPYGILSHDWSNYRSEEVFQAGVKKMLSGSLAF